MPSSINPRDIFLAPNLLSLSRVFLTIPIGYFLSAESGRGTLLCLILLIAAGLTDLFDGILARRLNQMTSLGLILDPLADKVLTITLIIELIFFRGFPIWLAVIILARDLVILLAGLYLMRGKELIVPSSLSGKYYFFSLAILLGSYIIRFSFGQALFLYIVLFLFVLSSFRYARGFLALRKGEEYVPSVDRPILKYGRYVLALIVVVWSAYRLYIDIIINM